MSDIAKQKAGRKYSVDSSGITTLKKDFIVIQDAVMSADGEAVSFPGVPAIGSAHPSYPGLVVQTYDVQEGEGKDKQTLIVTANYGPQTTETSGTGQDAVTSIVTEWGWDDGTDEKELVIGEDGTPVLNSAGDPFDSVPKVSTPAPVFTKVMKFKKRQTGWNLALCSVNDSRITIGGVPFPVATLLCTISEKRLIGEAEWKYQYTVRLRYKTNLVKVAGSSSLTEIGWDVAIADAGMRELDTNGKPQLIKQMDPEKKTLVTVTSTELLDGHGHKVARTSGSAPEPYYFRFQAYNRQTWPSWLYSEPTAQEEGL